MTEKTAPETEASDAQRLGISDDLLEILVCPVDHSQLSVNGDDLVCTECGQRYPVQNGIPNMVVE